MPISVSCTGCGSKLTVRDELLGKRIKCPKCGAGFTAAQAAAQMRQVESAGAVGRGIHLSPGVIAFLCALILIPGTLLAWKFGPGRVRQRIFDMAPKADSDVRDVLDRSLEAYL